MPFGMPDFEKLNESAEKMVKASEKTIKFSEKLINVMNVTNKGLDGLNQSIKELVTELKRSEILSSKEGLGSSLIQAGGRVSEAALASGLPQLLAGKNPATILAEQTTGIIGVGALGGVAIIAVGGIVYVMVKASGNEDEKEKQQATYYGYNFRG